MNQELLPNRKNGRKGSPPPAASVVGVQDNLSRLDPEDKRRVNMLISQSKKMEMFTYAKERGKSLTELLIIAFDEYKARNT